MSASCLTETRGGTNGSEQMRDVRVGGSVAGSEDQRAGGREQMELGWAGGDGRAPPGGVREQRPPADPEPG